MEVRYNILNAKETKKIVEKLKEDYGIKEINLDYMFVKVDDKLFIASPDFKQLSTEGIHNFGLFFARILDGGMKLSIGGSQLIGKHAAKNVIELDSESIKKWLAGYNVDFDINDGFFLVKYKDDFFGCGKVRSKVLINSIPRERRIYTLSSGSRQDSLV